jgi:hypothetical protein
MPAPTLVPKQNNPPPIPAVGQVVDPNTDPWLLILYEFQKINFNLAQMQERLPPAGDEVNDPNLLISANG